MAVLMPEGPGALLTTVGEDKPRIRVRLHFGGDFAQEGPRQWRYVGGEVYNESFPVDSKYAEVMKRLNDKFGDTVSFKYLCPGDDMDPDNLVQVQGDDDLREMCVEYQNALQKTSTPVNTVRIKVFVYRAVIFEQEVQELDEELGEDDELMTHGGEDELLSSCDPVDCGPNWSDWGDPDEQYVTHSSVRSVQFSSDAEQHASIAPAAVMALPYITSMSVNSITSAPAYFSVPPAPLTSAGGMGGAGSKASPQWLPQLKQPPPGALAHPLLQPKRLSGHGASGEENYDAIDNCGGSSSSGGHVGSSRPHHRGGQVTAAAAAVLVADSLALGEEAGAYVPSGLNVLAELSYARRYGAEGTFMDTEQLEQSGEQLYYDAIVLEDRGEEVATAEKAGGTEGEEQEEGVWVQPEDPYNLVCQPLSQEQQWSLHKEPPGYNWTEAQGEARDPVQGGWRHDCECGLEWSRLEQQQTQERQTQEQQERRLEQQQQMQTQTQERLNLGQDDQHRAVCLPPGVGFYSDGELEDPYFNASSADAPDLRLLCVTDAGRVQNRSSAASDGVLRVIPRAEDVAAYGEQAEGHLGPNGVRAAGTGALLDLLPRHISAFGDSSRDDIKSGGGPLLPSRITIFGDDGSLNGTPGSGGGSLIGVGGRHGFGELHRLALSGGRLGAAAARWPYPRVNADDAVIVGPCDVDAGTLGRVADDLMKSVTTFFYTQEMQPTSTQEPGTHGSGGEEKMCGGRGGRPGKPLGMGDSLSRPNGPEIDLGGVDRISSATGHSHLLKGVVKKRKSEVSILAKIGEGAFGEVSQAQVFPYGIVAVKWLKRERFAKYSESFQREAETLAKLNHPNIIRMFGLVMDTPDSPSSGGASSGGGGVSGRGAGQAAHGGSGGGSGGNNNHGGGSSPSGAVTPTGPIGGIITEFVRNGSLGQYLRSLNGKRLSLRQRAMIALQAALGMAYLHEQSPAVVHFDLKPDNLLVDGEGDSMVIKVADFGLSKHKLSNYVSCRDLRGTLPYMAYELVSGNDNVSEKVDVYSMGVVMWEMYTGEVPFAHLTAQEILTGLLHGNLHLAIPPACEPEWRSLVETCMDPNPANRPSFQELVMQLQEILRLERQASNASSAAAAAAAAVLDSDTSVAGKQPSDNTVGWRLPAMAAAPAVGAAAGPGLAQVRSPRAGPPVPQPPPVQAAQALLARQQAQMQAAAAAAAAAQQQQRPLSPQPPQQQQHPPLLAPLQQQHAPPLPQHHAPPFQVQHQYGNLQFALPPAAARQNPTQAQLPQQQPVPPQHPPPQQQHIHYLPQLAPGLILQQPQQQHIPVPPAHLYQLPLRPQPLFQPPPQQHGQHLNGLYGMVGGGGVSGGGLPALVSWSDRI